MILKKQAWAELQLHQAQEVGMVCWFDFICQCFMTLLSLYVMLVTPWEFQL